MNSFFKTMKKSKEDTSTVSNSSLPNQYTEVINTDNTQMDGSYECEEVDILNFENVNVSFPTD